MSKLDVLKATRALLADPAHWTKGAWARGADGDPVHYSSGLAICWCLGGALMRCWGKDGPFPSYLDARDALSRAAEARIPVFNDSHDHAAVLALLDSVIAQEQPHAA